MVVLPIPIWFTARLPAIIGIYNSSGQSLRTCTAHSIRVITKRFFAFYFCHCSQLRYGTWGAWSFRCGNCSYCAALAEFSNVDDLCLLRVLRKHLTFPHFWVKSLNSWCPEYWKPVWNQMQHAMKEEERLHHFTCLLCFLLLHHKKYQTEFKKLKNSIGIED